MMTVWLLLGAGLLLLVAEACIPSGGLLLLLALGCLGWSLFEAFQIAPALGWTVLGLDLLLTPATLGIGLYLWQKSPLAAKMTLRRPDRDERDRPPEPDDARPVVGSIGRTLTPLRPTGYVDFDGVRLEGHAEEGWLPEDVVVLAVAARGARVVVRRSPTASQASTSPPIETT